MEPDASSTRDAQAQVVILEVAQTLVATAQLTVERGAHQRRLDGDEIPAQ